MGTIVLIFEAISKIADAIPVIDKWLQQFWYWYAARKIAAMKDEDRRAVISMLETKDQREVEKLLGYSRSGEPSGIPGAEYPSDIPGVPKPKP